MNGTHPGAPPRGFPLPEGSVVLSMKAQRALRTILFGDLEDRSPSLRNVKRALDEAGCDDREREALLQALGISHSETPP